MKEKYYTKFHEYLKDVVKHFQETGSLRNFSDIALKHKCTKITIPLFYEYDLHLIEGEPSRKTSDLIRDRIADDERKRKGLEVVKPRFNKGDIIAWIKDGRECVAVADEDDMFFYCTNYDKQGDFFVSHNIPDDVEFVKPSYAGIIEYLQHLSAEEDYYRKTLQERATTLFG